MKSKYYFIVEAVLNFLFGFSLVFLKGVMTDEFIVNAAMRNDVTDFLSQMLGTVLIGAAVLNFYARNAEPSIARTAILLMGVTVNGALFLIHLLAIDNGIEKSAGWSTVVMHAVMGAWGAWLLKGKK